MRTLIKILCLLLVSFSLKANNALDSIPSGYPSPYSTSWYRVGWLMADSGSVPARRDTTFQPRFAGTSVFWQHSGVDSVSWVWNGRSWKRGGGVSSFNGRSGNVLLLSSDVTTALGYTPLQNITSYIQAGANVGLAGLGTLASPYVISSTASGTGTVQQFSFSNGNGLVGTVTSPTLNPSLSLGTNITGVVYANGTGFSALGIGSGLTLVGNTLSANGGTSLTGVIVGDGSAFNTATIGAGLAYNTGTKTLSNTITNNNQLTNGANFISNITGLVNAGANVTVTGSGTIGSPYIISSSAAGAITGAGNLSPLFTTSISSNTLTFALSTAPALSVYSNLTGSTANPSFGVPNATIINSWYGGTLLTNSLASGDIFVGNGSNVATAVAMSGDATLANTGALTLATVNTNTGTWGSASTVPQFTVIGKGLITAVSPVSIQINESQVTNLVTDLAAKLTNVLPSGQIFVGNGSNLAVAVAMSGDATISNAGVLALASVITPGSCTNCILTYDAKGRIVAAASAPNDSVYAINGLTANGTDTLIWGGGLTQNTRISANAHTLTFDSLSSGLFLKLLSNKTPSGTDSMLIVNTSGQVFKSVLAAGSFITSLTTTGTSGAATVTTGVLNIPQYQGALTLTTTGSSGAATLIGNTLNIPQYSGGATITSPNSTITFGGSPTTTGDVVHPNVRPTATTSTATTFSFVTGDYIKAFWFDPTTTGNIKVGTTVGGSDIVPSTSISTTTSAVPNNFVVDLRITTATTLYVTVSNSTVITVIKEQ